MKIRHLFLTLLLALVVPWAANAQTNLTVCDGTANSQYIPFEGYNADATAGQQNQMIYPADLLTDMVGKEITTMKFYIDASASNGSNTAASRLGTWTISLGETEETTLTGLDNTTTLTPVYTGYLDCSSGILTLAFDNGYTYGGKNLLVQFYKAAGSNTGQWNRWYFLGETTENNASYGSYNSTHLWKFLPKNTFTYQTPATCSKPTLSEVADEDITSTTATVRWTPSDVNQTLFDIYYSIDNTAPDATTTPSYSNVSGTSKEITGLTAATQYYVWIRGNCGTASDPDISGGWTTAKSFMTACGTIPVGYTCGFESPNTGGTSSNPLPTCWSRPSTGASTTYPYAYNYSYYAHQGTYSLYFYGNATSTKQIAVMPASESSLNGKCLKFYAILSSTYASGTNVLSIGYMVDPDDASTFVEVAPVTLTTSYPNEPYMVSFGEYTDDPRHIAIRSNMNGSYSIYVDDVTFDNSPTCFKPQNLTCTAYTSTTATLTWERHAMGTENAWVLQYSTDNTFATGVQSVDVSTTPSKELTGLTAETKYYARVRPDCDENLWSDVCEFKPSASQIVTIGSGENTNNCIPAYTLYNNTLSEQIYTSAEIGMAGTISSLAFYNGGTTKTPNLKIYLVNTDKTAFASTTEWLTVTAEDLVFEGNVALTAGVWTTIDFDRTFEYNGCSNLGLIVDANMQYSSGLACRVFTGTEYCSMYVATDGTNYDAVGASYSGTRLSVKNQLQLSILPNATPKPYNLALLEGSLSSTGATVTWQAPCTATPTGYEYQYKASTGEWPTAWTATNDLSATLEGLVASTVYDVRVKAIYSGGNESACIETEFTTLDACAIPTNLLAYVTPGQGTQATLTWVKGYDEERWVLQYGTDPDFAEGTYQEMTSGFIPQTDPGLENVVAAVITGLTAEQTYYARVKANCDGSTSEWSNVAEFMPTYYIDFTYGNNPTSTTSYVPFYGYYANYGTLSQFIIPASDLLDLAGGTIRSMTFYSSNATVNWGNAVFDVYVKEVDATAFESSTANGLEDWTSMTNVYSGSLSISDNQMVISFTEPIVYNGGNLMIGFNETTLGSSASVSWYYVTGPSNSTLYAYKTYSSGSLSYTRGSTLPKVTFNYLPTAYPRITTIAEGTITETTAQITWTAPSANVTGYAYQYKLSDGTWPETWENLAANATSVTLESLTSASTYDFRIKALYGENESVATTISFATTCELAVLPWKETFDTWANGIIDDPCWVNERLVDGTGTSGILSLFQVDGGKLKLPDMKSGTITKLMLPDMEIPANVNYRFVISVNRNASGTSYPNEGVRVFASQNGEIEGAQELGFLYRNCEQTDNGVVTAETATGWYTYEFAIPFNGPCNIILQGESYYGNATFMDDLKVNEIPHCAKPSELTIVESTGTTATFDWTDGEEGLTAWQIAYKAGANFDPDTDECTIANVTTKPGTITGLQAGTNYFAYIRSNCGDGTYSDWSEAYEFESTCLPIASLNTDFDSYTGVSSGSTNNLPTCWNYINETTASSYKGYPVIYSASSYSHSGTNHLRFCSYSYSDPQDQYAILPEMESLNGMRIEFWARYTNTTNNLIVGVMTDPTDVETFVPLTDGTIDDLTMAYAKYRFDIDEVEGKYIAFKMPAATTSTKYVLIDDLRVRPIPECEDVENLGWTGSTAHSVNINWTPLDENQDQWQVAYKAGANFDPTDAEALATATIADVDENPAHLEELLANTTYYIYVRANCGNDSYGEWSEQYTSFTTKVGNIAPFSVVAQQIEANSALIVWVEQSNDYHEYCELYYSTEATAPEANVSTSDPNLISRITAGQYRLEGLTPLTPYYVWVRDYCGSDGYSTWTALDDGFFTTLATCPGAVDLAVTENSETAEGATVAWTFAADSYKVFYGEPEETIMFNYDFEDGTIPATFTNDATLLWTVTDDDTHSSSNYAIKSGGSSSSYSNLTLQVNLIGAGTISFWARISSEDGYDKGYFYIDNTIQSDLNGISGDGEWIKYTYTLAAGTHTLKWSYYKDSMYNYYDDCFYVDDIVITSSTVNTWNLHGTATESPYLIDGLEPETTYQVKLQSLCGAEEGEDSNIVEFTTIEACSTPTQFELAEVDAHSASFNWNGGNATDWKVWVKKSSDSDYPTEYTTVQNTPSATIDNLDAATAYDVKITSGCDDTKTLEVLNAFTTHCNVITVDADNSYGVDFSTWIPNCWELGEPVVIYSTTYNWKQTSGAAHSGAYGTINLYMPTLNIVGDHASLTFQSKEAYTTYYTGGTSGSHDGLSIVKISTDNGTTWTQLWCPTLTELSTTYRPVTIELDNYVGQDILIAFEYQGTNAHEWYIDDVEVTATNDVSGQTIELSEGWNWVSIYVEGDPVDLLDQLKESLGDNATEIQSYDYTTEYEGDGEWFGDLDEEGIEPTQMFMINVVNACSFLLEGEPVVTEEYEITINPGWNWIGFPSNVAVEVNEALADFEAEEGDEIQSKDYATEFDGDEWFGDLEEFQPGEGLMYFSNSGEPKTLTFVIGAKKRH